MKILIYLKKWLLAGFGIITIIIYIKSIIKKIIELNVSLKVTNFERDFNMKSYKDVQGAMNRKREVDEKIDNMSDSDLNKLM